MSFFQTGDDASSTHSSLEVGLLPATVFGLEPLSPNWYLVTVNSKGWKFRRRDGEMDDAHFEILKTE
jgi:hypothetical protein